MAGYIEAALGLLATLGDMFLPTQQFFRSAPRPISWILQLTFWMLVLAAMAVLVAAVNAISTRIILSLTTNTIRHSGSMVRGLIIDEFNSTLTFFSNIAGVAGFGSTGSVDTLPTLHPVGTLSDGPTIHWTIQDSLVAATED